MSKRHFIAHLGPPNPVSAFSMVELVLALGLVAVGLVSIMALFPIGVSAGRDAMAEGCSGNAAEQLLHRVEYLLRHGTGGWTTRVAAIRNSQPSATQSADFSIDGVTAMANTNGTVFENSAITGVYKVIRYIDENDDGAYNITGDILDFEAIMTVWRAQVVIPTPSGSNTLGYGVAVALCAEISWPAKLPYSRRQKSEYRLELFNR